MLNLLVMQRSRAERLPRQRSAHKLRANAWKWIQMHLPVSRTFFALQKDEEPRPGGAALLNGKPRRAALARISPARSRAARRRAPLGRCNGAPLRPPAAPRFPSLPASAVRCFDS